MSLARKLEQRLEQLVDGLSATLFRGRMDPAELGSRVVRQADLLVEEADLGPSIPNRFTVRVNPRDISDDVSVATLNAEATRAVGAAAAERGWRTGGPIEVTVEASEDVGAGAIECRASRAPGPIAPWGQLIDMGGAGAFGLSDNRVVLGRSSAADVSLAQPEVSRRHAVVFRRSGSVWIADLGSANGTRVNGTRIDSEPVELRGGDQLELGPATLSLRII